MSRKNFKRYLRQNPSLKSWLKANGEWFTSNPESIRHLIEDPAILTSFQHSLMKKKKKLHKRINRIEMRNGSAVASRNRSPRRKLGLNLKLPSLSSMNQTLANTTEILDNIQSVMDSFTKK